MIKESKGADGVAVLTAVNVWLGSGFVSKVASFYWAVSTENAGLLGYSYRGIVTFTCNAGEPAVYLLHHVQRQRRIVDDGLIAILYTIDQACRSGQQNECAPPTTP